MKRSYMILALIGLFILGMFVFAYSSNALWIKDNYTFHYENGQLISYEDKIKKTIQLKIDKINNYNFYTDEEGYGIGIKKSQDTGEPVFINDKQVEVRR